MNFQEIKAKLDELGITKQDIAHGDYMRWDSKLRQSVVRDEIKEAVGNITQVEHYGGEGEGEKWYTVVRFDDHDVYARIDGFYQSYSGVDFYDEELREVRPQTRTLTVYE